MKLRILSISLLVVLGLGLVAPLSTAQTPSSNVVVKAEFEHPTVTVPDNGRLDIKVTVTAVGSNFACVQDATLHVALQLDSFAKWAGSSMEPKEVIMKIPQGQPGTGPTKVGGDQEANLNLAWNVEDAPRAGAKQDYYVIIQSKPNPTIDSGPCAPQPALVGGKFGPMTATLPDRPLNASVSGSPDCNTDPFQPACQALQTTAPAKSPGFDGTFLVFALASLVAVTLRRRT